MSHIFLIIYFNDDFSEQKLFMLKQFIHLDHFLFITINLLVGKRFNLIIV